MLKTFSKNNMDFYTILLVFYAVIIINRILFTANTNLRFWSPCPNLGTHNACLLIINSFQPDLCTSSQESHTEAFRLFSCPHPNHRRRPLRPSFGWTGQGDRSARSCRRQGWWLSLIGRVCVHTARGAPPSGAAPSVSPVRPSLALLGVIVRRVCHMPLPLSEVCDG
jgi:hypothetical protein